MTDDLDDMVTNLASLGLEGVTMAENMERYNHEHKHVAGRVRRALRDMSIAQGSKFDSKEGGDREIDQDVKDGVENQAP